jgi:hypothetical protein
MRRLALIALYIGVAGALLTLVPEIVYLLGTGEHGGRFVPGQATGWGSFWRVYNFWLGRFFVLPFFLPFGGRLPSFASAVRLLPALCFLAQFFVFLCFLRSVAHSLRSSSLERSINLLLKITIYALIIPLAVHLILYALIWIPFLGLLFGRLFSSIWSYVLHLAAPLQLGLLLWYGAILVLCRYDIEHRPRQRTKARQIS